MLSCHTCPAFFIVLQAFQCIDDSSLQGKGDFIRIGEGFELSREISIAKYVKRDEKEVRLKEGLKLKQF